MKKDVVYCPRCLKVFKYKYRLDRHMQRKTKCPKQMGYKVLQFKNMLEHHNNKFEDLHEDICTLKEKVNEL